MPWPPPGTPAQPNAPYGAAGQQPSDTLERMLRPQGLFQGMQPRPGDWQQPPGQDGQPTWPGGDPRTAGYGGPDWGATQHGPGSYPPGDFGNAQYAQGQFGQAPYPPGQYPPAGQYPPGQYPPAGQYPPGQYPPAGQYGPGGPFGPGGQFGPAGPPARDARRSIAFGKVRLNLPKSPLVPAVVGAALVVVVAVAVVLAAQNGGSSSPAGTAMPAGTQPTATSSAPSLAEKQAATRLAGLLAQSGNDRSDVNAAAGNVEECKDLAPAAAEFTKAATNRSTLLAKLAKLPGRSALPSALVSDIKGAWQASATVDQDLAKWASSEASGGCRKGKTTSNPNWTASLRFDGVASSDKSSFVTLWNPLARKDGLPTYTVDQL